jgi:hypothetical protein
MSTVYHFLYVIHGDEGLGSQEGTIWIEAVSEERAWVEAEAAVKADYPPSEGWTISSLTLIGEVESEDE